MLLLSIDLGVYFGCMYVVVRFILRCFDNTFIPGVEYSIYEFLLESRFSMAL